MKIFKKPENKKTSFGRSIKANLDANQTISQGDWVVEKSDTTLVMCVGKILDFGMCEVVYGKKAPFNVYKRRLETLRVLSHKEMRQVRGKAFGKIQQYAETR